MTLRRPAQLLAHLNAMDVHVERRGSRLRLDAPYGVLTSHLLADIKQHKTELLELLSLPHQPESDPTYPLDQQQRPAAAQVSDSETVEKTHAAFSDIARTTVDNARCLAHNGTVEADRAQPRSEVARLIRRMRRSGSRDLAVALRDAWRERVAICTVDGGLSKRAAEQIAVTELETLAAPAT